MGNQFRFSVKQFSGHGKADVAGCELQQPLPRVFNIAYTRIIRLCSDVPTARSCPCINKRRLKNTSTR
jgi:hypothetical protein